MSILTSGYGSYALPPLLVTQGYAPALDWRGRYQSAHGSSGGVYPFASVRGQTAGRYLFVSTRGLVVGRYAFASVRGFASALGRYTFTSARGLVAGIFAYQSSGGVGMGATPVGSTPQTVNVRTHERNVPFSLSFASDVAAADVISSAVVTVTARPAASRLSAATDVTGTMLMGQQINGTTVVVTIGNANAVLGTHYLIRVVATMASGVVLQETIGDGESCIILCNE